MTQYRITHLSLQDDTLPPALGFGGFQGGQNGLVKHVLQALLRQRGALHELHGTQLSRQLVSL